MGWLRSTTLIERLVGDIGWLVAEREGDHYLLRRDDGSPMTYVNVRCRDDHDFVTLCTKFPVRFPLSALSPELTLGLLQRNREVYFGRWCIDVLESCELVLILHHTAIKAGLTPGRLKAILDEMVGERETLHSLLRGQVGGLHQLTLPPWQPSGQSGATGRNLATRPGQQAVPMGW